MGVAETLPPIVYKVRNGSITDDSYASLIGYDDNPPFTDEQIDIVAQALAETRIELRSEIEVMIANAMSEVKERISRIEGQLDVLMMLLSGDGGIKSLEATERKLKVSR